MAFYSVYFLFVFEKMAALFNKLVLLVCACGKFYTARARARLLQLNVDSSLLFLLMFAFDHVNAREDLLLLLCGVCSLCALMFARCAAE
jgi:hypothetical protein